MIYNANSAPKSGNNWRKRIIPNQEGETREEDLSPRESDNEADYNEEQYPLADEKYK